MPTVHASIVLLLSMQVVRDQLRQSALIAPSPEDRASSDDEGDNNIISESDIDEDAEDDFQASIPSPLSIGPGRASQEGLATTHMKEAERYRKN